MNDHHILNKSGSAISETLIALRDISQQNDSALFRYNLKKIGRMMAYELSKTIDYEKRVIKTSLGEAKEWAISEQIVIISILRAAGSMAEGFTDIFAKSEIGMIGAMRKEGKEIEIDLSYVALPDINGKRVMIIDPMLATGKSMVKTVDTLLKRGKPSNIDIACLVSTPEGVEHLEQNISAPFKLWTCAMDSHLNEEHYIVPGLGDAGDLAYGRKI